MASTSTSGSTGSNLNPLYDPATDNLPIAADVQSMLNQPLVDPAGFDPADEAFIRDVVAKFESGEIQPYGPSSLLNMAVYDALDDAKKGKADQNALILLGRLRDIVALWKANPAPTFQLKNQIHSIRLTKERLEGELGDVFRV